MKIIATNEAPAAIGPYSQGMITGNLVYTSGQIPVDPKTGAIAGDTIETQAEQSLKNVRPVLGAGGAPMGSIVRTPCFIADMADFAAFNAVYAQYIKGAPARSCVAVKTLPKNVLVEIEAIAEIVK